MAGRLGGEGQILDFLCRGIDDDVTRAARAQLVNNKRNGAATIRSRVNDISGSRAVRRPRGIY